MTKSEMKEIEKVFDRVAYYVEHADEYEEAMIKDNAPKSLWKKHYENMSFCCSFLELFLKAVA